MAAPAPGRLAAALGPVLRRPGPVGSGDRGWVVRRGPRPTHHGPHGLLRRRRGPSPRPGTSPAAGPGIPRPADRARTRPRVARRHAHPRGSHPGREPGTRAGRAHPAYEPGNDAHPQPPRADLSGHRGRARADDRGGGVSHSGCPHGSTAGRAPGRRRRDPARRRRDRQLREPERRLGHPSPGPCGRRPWRLAGPDHDRGPARRSARGREPGGGGDRAGAVARRGRVARRERVPACHPADRGGPAHRCDPAPARHQRAAPARARAAHQGRDHPRDPPSRQEQPADGGGAVADAVTPASRQRGARCAR